MKSKKPILYIGRIIESKGIVTLIQAYSQIAEKLEICNQLWIIGGNHSEIESMRNNPKIKNEILNLEERNLIFWWGHLPHDILPYIIRKCLFSCFTSYYEPGGRTILETMACGLPVIANPYGFAEEVVISHETGFLITNNSLNEWVTYMEFLIKHPAVATKMGKNAQMLIRNKFNMQEFYRKHWDIYKMYQ